MVYKLLVDSMKYAKQHSIRHRQQMILRTGVKLQWQYLAAEIEIEHNLPAATHLPGVTGNIGTAVKS